MMLAWLIVVLLAGGLLAWLVGQRNERAARLISLAALVVDFVWVVAFWAVGSATVDRSLPPSSQWLVELEWPWIPRFGIGLHLAMDGLSLLLLVLTFFLGIVSVVASRTEIEERVGFYHFNLLWVLAGVTGVFVALDLFLFYFFWEMMLVPMYFLIGIWGHQRRIYAAIKFFLFTQLSGLLMLTSIIGLALVHYRATGILSFDYTALLGMDMPIRTAWWLMLGFFAAFAVKLPVFPFHTWLPDAHTEAPTAGSVILAGLLLKTGAYGLLRFLLPLFPAAARLFTPVALTLAVIGILYGAFQAFAQTDLKRLVAYSSVSHLGFVLLGVFAWNELALQGSVMQMICHGVSTGALFILVGALQERIHTRDMSQMGGLWTVAPRMGAVGMFFAMASLGLPGLGNFVGEFLVLVGSYPVSRTATAVATLGLVASTVYSLRFVQRAFHGENSRGWSFPDLGARHMMIFSALVVSILWLGLYPQTVLNLAHPALSKLQEITGALTAVAGR